MTALSATICVTGVLGVFVADKAVVAAADKVPDVMGAPDMDRDIIAAETIA